MVFFNPPVIAEKEQEDASALEGAHAEIYSGQPPHLLFSGSVPKEFLALDIRGGTFRMDFLILLAVEADLAWQIQAQVAMIARPTHDNFVGGITIIEKQAFTAPLPLSDEDGTPRRPAPAAILKKVQIRRLCPGDYPEPLLQSASSHPQTVGYISTNHWRESALPSTASHWPRARVQKLVLLLLRLTAIVHSGK